MGGKSVHRAQAEAELAAATAEIEATLLELKRERLLAQLAGGTGGCGDSAPGLGDALVAEDRAAVPLDAEAAAPGELLHSARNSPSDVRIGEEQSLGPRTVVHAMADRQRQTPSQLMPMKVE
jgi:hypothetical protein